MATYNSVKEIKNMPDNKGFVDFIDILELLERVNPCNQNYDIDNENIMISYELKLDLLNFFNRFHLNVKARIVGLPISICEKGYWGNVEEIIRGKKGLTIVLNSDSQLGCRGKTLSTFIFENKYQTFEEYLSSLRSPYRRRIKKALDKREDLIIKKIDNFNSTHYSLYKSVMERTKNPLEVLPLEYFRDYDSEVYEIRDRDTEKILAFFQLKQFDDSLYFLFCGFDKKDNDQYDLYYNLLIKIIEIGIEKGYKCINFGQTSEETKLKIGCKEKYKYLCIYHSNPILNKLFQFLLPYFSYKPYSVRHHVFKKE